MATPSRPQSAQSSNSSKDGHPQAPATIPTPNIVENLSPVIEKPALAPSSQHTQVLSPGDSTRWGHSRDWPSTVAKSSEPTSESSSPGENVESTGTPVEDLTELVVVIDKTPKATGNYSFVYLGTLRGEMVAVKVLRWVKGKEKAESIRRKARREQHVWANLRHPNILRFYGFSLKLPDPRLKCEFGAFISPWQPAGDAEEFLKVHRPSMSLTSRIQLWQGVVKGVSYLHTRTPPLVHGDLKPGNILVDNSGNARICDFGLVRIVLDEHVSDEGLKTTSDHAGTERYLAFELVTVVGAVPTEASDIYALGCLGLEIVFGCKPHEPHKKLQVLQVIYNGKPPATQTDNLDPYETAVWNLLKPCWAFKPDERPHALRLLTQTAALLSRTRDKRFSDTDHWMCQYTVSKEWLNPPTPDYEG